MRPPGTVIQLDELEYLLSGLYPGVVLAIEGDLPFQGLEERLHDGIVVGGQPSRENDWTSPRPSSSLQKHQIRQDTNSLERYSNLGILLKELETEYAV